MAFLHTHESATKMAYNALLLLLLQRKRQHQQKVPAAQHKLKIVSFP